ncbi:MAG: glycosyltransferase [Solirubrobacteraceae bacterium]
MPNAVEAPGDVSCAPAELDRLPRPRLGYAGTLHSTRLDIELLKAAAELRPAWSFVLLGPDLLEEPDRSRLFNVPNIHYLGVVSHPQVRPYLSGMDVCLLPNHVTDFTRSLDPLKLYEYLAAGRPVVATPAGIATELEHHIALATTAEEVVDQAQQAIDEDGPRLAVSRQWAVAGATWEARAETIENALGLQTACSRTTEVSVVIVSFNTRDLLERCLRALHQHADIPVQTIVVDNASTDGSREVVRDRFPDVELVELSTNTGFAHANNVGFRRCRGTYVLLLNSDAFIHSGSLNELVATAERHPRAAAVGPRLLNPDGTLQRSAWPFPRAGRLLLEAFGLHRLLRRSGLLEDLGIWAHDQERSVDFLVGACLLLRADALSELIGFDEGFWLYGEEADLQRRARARGWSVIFTPRAVVTHVGGASSVASSPRLRHFYAGQMRFLRKHGGPGAWPAARFALLAGSVLRRRWTAARVAMKPR